MTLTRECICPIIISRGADQQSISTRFEDRKDPGVAKNFGRLILEFAKIVPDGIVCFFVSYAYMDSIVSQWDELGILKELMALKLIFIETQVSTCFPFFSFFCYALDKYTNVSVAAAAAPEEEYYAHCLKGK